MQLRGSSSAVQNRWWVSGTDMRAKLLPVGERIQTVDFSITQLIYPGRGTGHPVQGYTMFGNSAWITSCIDYPQRPSAYDLRTTVEDPSVGLSKLQLRAEHLRIGNALWSHHLHWLREVLRAVSNSQQL